MALAEGTQLLSELPRSSTGRPSFLQTTFFLQTKFFLQTNFFANHVFLQTTFFANHGFLQTISFCKALVFANHRFLHTIGFSNHGFLQTKFFLETKFFPQTKLSLNTWTPNVVGGSSYTKCIKRCVSLLESSDNLQ